MQCTDAEMSLPNHGSLATLPINHLTVNDVMLNVDSNLTRDKKCGYKTELPVLDFSVCHMKSQ